MKNFFLFLLCLSFFSCRKERTNILTIESINITNYEAKKFLAKTLAKAVAENRKVRVFIKKEALKMFNNEFDILYSRVKDVRLENNVSFHKTIAQYTTSQDTLNAVISQNPLLTIYVPELPSFTAYSWNENDEIPYVSVEPENPEDDSPISTYTNKDSFEIPRGLIPGFPTIVVKDNDRIVLKAGNKIYSKNLLTNKVNIQTRGLRQTEISSVFFSNESGVYSFSDPVFDGVHQQAKDQTNTLSSSFPDRSIEGPARTVALASVQHLIDAFNSGQEWQRDNIYYGINELKGITSGKYNNRLREHLTSIRFTSKDVFDNISQAPDSPKPISPVKNPAGEWTKGAYEFRLRALVNLKSGAGPENNIVFFIKPSELFFLRYLTKKSKNNELTYHDPIILGTKLYVFPNPILIDRWDLSDSSISWRIYLMQYNNQQTVTESFSETNEFATNFEFNVGQGEHIKLGGKFGATTKESRTVSRSVQRSYGSNDFGSTPLYFFDKVILNYRINGNVVNYTPYEVQLGGVINLAIEPRYIY